MTFHQWYDANLHRLIKGNLHDALQEAWQRAQAAERERIMQALDAALMLRGGIPSEALLLARSAIAKCEGASNES
jgi:hypothetical protein